MSSARVHPSVWVWGICLARPGASKWHLSLLCVRTQERWRATAEQSKVESLQHSLEEQRRIMTQQLSMERAELERAKVRLADISRCFSHESDQGCTVVCGGGKSWVLGCSILPLPPQSHTRSHVESQSDQPSGTWMQEAAVCVRDACRFLRRVKPENPCRVHARHHGLEPDSRCYMGFSGRDG